MSNKEGGGKEIDLRMLINAFGQAIGRPNVRYRVHKLRLHNLLIFSDKILLRAWPKLKQLTRCLVATLDGVDCNDGTIVLIVEKASGELCEFPCDADGPKVDFADGASRGRLLDIKAGSRNSCRDG